MTARVLLPAQVPASSLQVPPGCPLCSEGTAAEIRWELGGEPGKAHCIRPPCQARCPKQPGHVVSDADMQGEGHAPASLQTPCSSLQWLSMGLPSAAAKPRYAPQSRVLLPGTALCTQGQGPHPVPLLPGDLERMHPWQDGPRCVGQGSGAGGGCACPVLRHWGCLLSWRGLFPTAVGVQPLQ